MEDSNDITTSPLAYTPQGNWEYAPFFKRNVYTGMSQADQAANLMTSDSFRNYWSKGATASGEGITGIRLNNPRQDFGITQLNEGRVNTERPFYGNQSKPTKGSTNGVLKFSGLRNTDPTYWDLRNQAGAPIKADRDALALLKYRVQNNGNTRYVSNNGYGDLLGLSAEIQPNGTMNPISYRFPADLRFRYNSSAQPLLTADAIMDYNRQLQWERDLFAYSSLMKNGKFPNLESGNVNNRVGARGPLYSIPENLDVPTPQEARPRPFALPTNPSQERRVGRITQNVVTGVFANGRPWTDPLPNSTTTTIYGPPDKYAGLKTALKNTAYVGAKVLAVVGGALEVARVPDRVKGYYINALKDNPNWRPDASDKFGMSLFAGVETAANFATMGLYDVSPQIRKDATSTAGYGKGYYGTMIPEKGTTSVQYNPDSRYDKKQGFEITDTINDEIGHYIK